MLRYPTLFLIVVATAAYAASPAEPAGVQVWAVPSVQKVRPDDKLEKSNLVWSGETKTISVAGARNEHVPFQVVITVPLPPTRHDKAASGFWVEASDLVSTAGRISKDRVRLYFEPVILCYGKSSPVGGTGFWPDALAPLSDPFDMAAPFRRFVKNRAVWVDVTVPKDAGAGTYSGTISVTQNGKPVDQLTIVLKVYSFALPDETHLLMFMNVSENWFSPHYDFKPRSAELRALTKKYYEFLYANRMEPWFNALLQPEFEERADGSIAVQFDDAGYEHFMNKLKTKRVILSVGPAKLTKDVRFPEFSEGFNRRVKSYLAQIVDYFRQHGWLNRLIINSPIDEPNSAQQFADTRKWAQLVHEAAPGVPFLVTKAPVSEHAEWGTLRGYANNFSIHGNALNEPAVKKAISEEQDKGGEITWYISCDQIFPQPNYFIDAPAMDPVMVPWITWRYGMNGILYWAVNYWRTANPWENPVTFLSGFLCSNGYILNGEGSLVYPGNHAKRYTGQQNVDGPVSSIRFELLREGIEDYEYLWLLKSLGDKNFADEVVRNLVVDVSSFSRNVEELFATREKLARRIEELSREKGKQ
ncbi:MAG TPA: glycoside hydrolase domain-containing protein [Acidobacteriota bacterium]|nr:glycoside hydrolase domain-containing protein [Acidobacteriota bacterium]